jgi:hypothetical protein
MTTTAKQFAAMLAEKRAACEVYATLESVGGQEYEAAGDRCTRADDALLALRPTSPAMLAAQLRWMLTEQIDGSHPGDRGVLSTSPSSWRRWRPPPACSRRPRWRRSGRRSCRSLMRSTAPKQTRDRMTTCTPTSTCQGSRLRAAIKLLDAAAGSAAQ